MTNDDDDEEYLSQEEIMQLIRDLQIKYGAEVERVQTQIETDIKRYGHLTSETKKARKEIRNKILSERGKTDGTTKH